MEKMSYLKRGGGEFLTKFCLFLMFFSLSAPGARAQDISVTPVQDGDVLEVKSMGDFWYSFEATEDGILTVESSNVLSVRPRQYADNTFTGEPIDEFNFGEQLKIKVEAGKTYYFGVFWAPGDVTLTIKFEAGASVVVELVSSTPEDGGTLDPASAENIELEFNMSVDVDICTLSYGGGGTVDLQSIPSGKWLSVAFRDVLVGLLEEGKVKGGDEVTVTLSGLRSTSDANVKYNGDGVLALTYTVAGLGAKLTGMSIPDNSTILSYYLPTDEAGVLKLEFDRPMGSAKAELMVGSFETDYHHGPEELPVTVEDNTVRVDLRGVRRVPGDPGFWDHGGAESGGEDVKNVIVNVIEAKDAEGNYTLPTGQGKVNGSYTFSYTIEVVPEADVAHEYTPSGGEPLDGVGSIELWMSDAGAFTFDAVRFACLKESDGEGGGFYRESVFTDAGKIKSAPSPDGDGTVLTIPVPRKAVAISDSAVIVSLNGLRAADGGDYEKEFSVTYTSTTGHIGAETAEVKIVKAVPEEGTALAVIGEGTDTPALEVSTNMDDEIGYMYLYIKENEDILRETWLEKKEDGTGFRAELAGTMTLYENHTYTAEYRAYASEDDFNYGNDPLGVVTVTYKGATPEFKFSDVKFLGITPKDSTVLESPADSIFVLTFSGPVVLSDSTSFVVRGQGMAVPYERLTPNEDGTEWTAVVDLEGLLRSASNGMPSVTISFAPTDTEGLLVEGNTGTGETSCLMFEYPTPFGLPEFAADPADGATVGALHVVTVSFEGGIMPSWNVPNDSVVVYDDKGNVAATLAGDPEAVIPEEEEDNWDYQPKAQMLTLDREITESGTYRLRIPEGYFNLGSEMSSINSREMTLTYTVAPDTHIGGVAADGAEGVTVYTVDGRLVLKSDDASGLKGLKKGVYIVNGKKTLVK